MLTGRAQQPEIPEPQEIEGFDFERDPETFGAVATGGVPMGHWKERSNCEHVLCYIGEGVVAVKWRTFKIHLKTYESLWVPVLEYQFPPVYCVTHDPGEANNLMKFDLSPTFGSTARWVQICLRRRGVWASTRKSSRARSSTGISL